MLSHRNQLGKFIFGYSKKIPALIVFFFNVVDPQIKTDVFDGREVFIKREFLGHIADRLFDCFRPGDDIMTADEGAARCRRQNAAKHPDRGRLSGAVRSEKSENLPFRNRKGNPIDGDETTEFFLQPVYNNRVSRLMRHGPAPCPPPTGAR